MSAVVLEEVELELVDEVVPDELRLLRRDETRELLRLLTLDMGLFPPLSLLSAGRKIT